MSNNFHVPEKSRLLQLIEAGNSLFAETLAPVLGEA
jgi:hypothetical protein